LAKKKPEAKPDLGTVVGGDGDLALVERFRMMTLADDARAKRIRDEADDVAKSVTKREPVYARPASYFEPLPS
jgi:hypothetical protein